MTKDDDSDWSHITESILSILENIPDEQLTSVEAFQDQQDVAKGSESEDDVIAEIQVRYFSIRNFSTAESCELYHLVFWAVIGRVVVFTSASTVNDLGLTLTLFCFCFCFIETGTDRRKGAAVRTRGWGGLPVRAL